MVRLFRSSAGEISNPKRWMASSATGRVSMAIIIVWVSAWRPLDVPPEVGVLPGPLLLAYYHLRGRLVLRLLPEAHPYGDPDHDGDDQENDPEPLQERLA